MDVTFVTVSALTPTIFRRRAFSGDMGSGAMMVKILRFRTMNLTELQEIRARQSGKQPPAEKVECIIELQYPTCGELYPTPV